MTSGPYRTAGDVGKTKLPRVIFQRDDKRLVQLADQSFIVECRLTRTDAMNMSSETWSKLDELRPPTPETDEFIRQVASYGGGADRSARTIAHWLAVRLAEIS